VGARVLRERRVLLERLCDRDALRALPPESLGHRYAEFMARERISGEGLAAVSEEVRDPERVVDPDRRLVFDRLRDMHDLWHVATGYDRDLVGEIALLAFSLAQTRNPGLAFIVGTVYLRSLRSGREAAPVRRMIRDGWRRGRRSEWLPAADWEALLSQPLAQVREELRLGPPPRYAEIRSAGAPPVPASH
jgi:ubiquinone biosynthesis protein COQ4